MWRLFAAGMVIAVAVVIVDFAVHLLNRPSDFDVAAGYLILLALFSAGASLIARRLR